MVFDNQDGLVLFDTDVTHLDPTCGLYSTLAYGLAPIILISVSGPGQPCLNILSYEDSVSKPALARSFAIVVLPVVHTVLKLEDECPSTKLGGGMTPSQAQDICYALAVYSKYTCTYGRDREEKLCSHTAVSTSTSVQ